MQALVSTPTFGKYLTLDQLQRYLDVPVGDLAGVLCTSEAIGCSAEDHEMFLATFGIVHDTFRSKTCWHLLGCGHVYTLGEEVCLRLLNARPQPEYL